MCSDWTVLQQFYQSLEAYALGDDTSEPTPIVDYTYPDVEGMEGAAGEAIQLFKEQVCV